jgi:tetratricopeptide (TPR) repeat protein
VIERTGGVPLFVEELTRAILESGSAQLSAREIPATLHDSLLARLDRVGPAKEVAQVGAVIGGEFSYELLRAVHPMAETELQAALRKLTDAELLYVQGIVPDVTYQFKHALIRDAAYEALLRSRRRELHGQVAVSIDEKFPALKQEHPELLARHWTEAGETERAIAEWQRAGKAAEARNAFIEAAESYRQAIALVKLLPESAERDFREMELAQLIVQPLIFTASYSAPESIQAMEHAAALAEKSGSLKQLVDLMILRGTTYIVASNFQASATLADRALELALREGSPVSIGRARALQINWRYWVGDLAGVEEHFMAGLKCFEHPDLVGLPFGAVYAFGLASWNAWLLGHADVARTREARCLTAVANCSPHLRAAAAFYAAVLWNYLGEYKQAQTLAMQALELSEQHQFTYTVAIAQGALGNALSRLGRTAEGIALIRRGIAGMLEIGTRVSIPAHTAHLAAALERQGDIVEALKKVEEALQLNPDQLFYRPEIFRLRGEFRLKQGQPELAEADFQESLKLARRMGARAWELRTTMSLARLLASQSHGEQARAILAEIYNWFTEGFDTADLKDAKLLLDELSP